MEARAANDARPWSPPRYVGPLVSGCVASLCVWPLDTDAANGDARHSDVVKRSCLWSILLFVALTGAPARGDGGRVQMHERAGPFIVTLFSTPDDLTAEPADLGLGLEDTETGEVINDAEIELSLSRIDSGSADPLAVIATNQTSPTGILQSAQVSLPSAGRWHVAIEVSRKGMNGRCSTDLSVRIPHQQQYEVWIAGMAPVLIALLLSFIRAENEGGNFNA